MTGKSAFILAAPVLLLLGPAGSAGADRAFRASDPGVRAGPPGAGAPLPGLTLSELAAFEAGRIDFEEAEGVGDGLGPTFNLDSCVGCHAQPAVGGTSPASNPQIDVAGAFGARNSVPYFVKRDGPVREARFRYKPDGTRDGGVHALFSIGGRSDASGDARGCNLPQEDYLTQARRGNLVFRIPTPVFGAGLIEQIPDAVIVANASTNTARKAALGIRGRPHRVRIDEGTTNLNGNDGTIARFGWKAQNKSLLLFSGEAYNVEMGISNELFQSTGCADCHTPTLTTGNAAVAALRNQRVDLFSDLLEAIDAHRSGPDPRFRLSEASRVVDGFGRLSEPQKQDVLNFLRSL